MSDQFFNDKTSPAGRLLAICNAALNAELGPTTNAVVVFSQVFLPKNKNRNDVHTISRHLLLCHSQVALVERIAKEKGVPLKLYEQALINLRDFFSPVAKDTSWSIVRAPLKQNVIDTLLWLTWGMKGYDSGGSIQEAEVLDSELQELLAVLRIHTEKGEVKLDDLIKRVERISEAVGSAGIIGSDEALDSVKDELISVVLNSEDIKKRVDEINDENLRTLLVNGFRKIYGCVNESGKFAGSLKNIIEMTGDAVKLLGVG